jgi:4-amino-4-deoxy-L-arabinose transferase-like glycosyltransferase
MKRAISPESGKVPHGAVAFSRRTVLTLLGTLWFVLFFVSLFAPPVLDDADGTHANAARQIMLSGDWVTLRVNDVRYLEKAPLPYWIVAASMRLFGVNTFAVHLPQAVVVLLLMLLGYRWARRAFGERAALYTGLGVLTSAGVFLFTRIFLPDALLSLLLAAALYCFLQSIDLRRANVVTLSGAQDRRASPSRPQALYPYAMWSALALAVLTKGLVAVVFVLGAVAAYLALTGEYRQWRRLRPFTGVLVFLAIAAPWHIFAGLRNTGGMDGHGFFWFYFVNEHVLRFLGRRIPMDYNRLPGYLYWGLHLVWLFPWSLFFPIFVLDLVRKWRQYGLVIPEKLSFATVLLLAVYFFVIRAIFNPHWTLIVIFSLAGIIVWGASRGKDGPSPVAKPVRSDNDGRRAPEVTLVQKTSILLSIYSFLVLAFFSLSTNQEYYTFPAYLPLLMLMAAAVVRAEAGYDQERSTRLWIGFTHAAFTVIGVAVAAALAYGLWTSRGLSHVADIGDVMAHRGVGGYTLSMSSLFDLTGPSFAALRLPASLALAAFAIGPGVAWMMRARRRHIRATVAIGITGAVFLIAAHMALGRFAPVLSSHDFAERIQQLEGSGAISRDNTLLLFGDQAYGSSIPFYLDRPLDRPALLVDGRSSSMLFGSTFPDAQGLFLTPAEMLARWGSGERKLMFVPAHRRDEVDRLLGSRQFLLQETSGKALITDRPLER